MLSQIVAVLEPLEAANHRTPHNSVAAISSVYNRNFEFVLCLATCLKLSLCDN